MDVETRGPASFDVDPHVPEDLQHLVKAVIANLLTNDIAVVVQKEEGGEVGHVVLLNELGILVHVHRFRCQPALIPVIDRIQNFGHLFAGRSTGPGQGYQSRQVLSLGMNGTENESQKKENRHKHRSHYRTLPFASKECVPFAFSRNTAARASAKALHPASPLKGLAAVVENQAFLFKEFL